MKTRTLILLAGLCSAGAFVQAQTNDAAANWSQHCARCHAKDGSADTKPGKKLKLKDYRDAAVQATFSDEEIIRVMVEGVTNDKGKQEMPSYTEKMSKEEMEALVPFIRGLATPQ